MTDTLRAGNLALGGRLDDRTETIGSSMRTYAENARAMYANPGAEKPARGDVKAAVIHMPLDAPLPRAWAERKVNVAQFSEMPRGGHFAAWEAPEAFARDLQAFARLLSPRDSSASEPARIR